MLFVARVGGNSELQVLDHRVKETVKPNMTLFRPLVFNLCMDLIFCRLFNDWFVCGVKYNQIPRSYAVCKKNVSVSNLLNSYSTEIFGSRA